MPDINRKFCVNASINEIFRKHSTFRYNFCSEKGQKKGKTGKRQREKGGEKEEEEEEESDRNILSPIGSCPSSAAF